MNYIQEAIKTESLNLAVDHPRLLHACMGLATESIEAMLAAAASDEVNLQEELGDMLWYSAIAADCWDTTFEELVALADESRLTDDFASALFWGAGEALDQMKKATFYGRELDETKVAMAVATILRAIETTCRVHGWDFEALKTRNIAKLRARYGEAFSEAAAENRDLKAEQEAVNNA